MKPSTLCVGSSEEVKGAYAASLLTLVQNEVSERLFSSCTIKSVSKQWGEIERKTEKERKVEVRKWV